MSAELHAVLTARTRKQNADRMTPESEAQPAVPEAARRAHTPGPWFAHEREKAGFIYCWVGSNDEFVADMSPAYVAAHSKDADVMRGNLALVAAAPELLEVANSILSDDLLPYLPAEYIAKVRAVIAKAEGRQS